MTHMDPEPEPLRSVPDPPPDETSPEIPPDEAVHPTDAARVLSVDPSRIRQLVKNGKLDAFQQSPLRVTRRSLVKLKDERDATKKLGVMVSSGDNSNGGRHAGGAEPMDAREVLDRLNTMIEQITGQHLREIESSEAASKRAEQAHSEAYHESRDRAERAEAQARELREQAENLREKLEQERISRVEAETKLEVLSQAQQKRGGWFIKGKG